MKQRVMYTIVLCISIIAVSCADDEDSGTQSKTAVERSIVDLPSCISKDGDATREVSESTVEDVRNVYEPIRATLGGINDWSLIAREVVSLFEKDVLPTASSGDWENTSMNDEDDVSRIEWEQSETDFDTHAEIFWKDAAGDDVKGIDLLLTLTDKSAKGLLTFDISAIPDENESAENNTKLTIHFDGTVSPKTMIFKASNMIQEESTDPTSLYAKAWFYADNHFEVSASYYFPEAEKITTEENSTETEERTYTFTITGYDEEGKDSTKKNSAILKLAYPLVPEDENTDTTGIFTENSVGKIYADTIYSALINEWDSDTNITLSDLKSITDAEITASTIAELTNDDVEAIIAGYASSPDASEQEQEDIGGFIYISKLVNPAYFISDGFSGTYDGTTGTLGSVPAWADGSELDIDALDSEVIAPITVKNLAFDSTAFIVK